MRIAANDGALSSVGVDNVARWSYIYQTVNTHAFTNQQAPTATVSAVGGSNTLRTFPTKLMTLHRTAEIGTPTNEVDFLGFPGGTPANDSLVRTPIAVEYTTGVARPRLVRELAFHIGGAMDAGLDALRAYDGQVFGMMTYREAHDASQRAAVESWISSYHYRSCYSIMTPFVSPSGPCSGGVRDDYCW